MVCFVVAQEVPAAQPLKEPCYCLNDGECIAASDNAENPSRVRCKCKQGEYHVSTGRVCSNMGWLAVYTCIPKPADTCRNIMVIGQVGYVQVQRCTGMDMDEIWVAVNGTECNILIVDEASFRQLLLLMLLCRLLP